MKKSMALAVLVGALTVFTLPFSAQAANCGKVKGQKIVAYGGLSCAKAKKIYQSFQSGHIPKGWTCGQSVGACAKGKMGFRFNFTNKK